MHNKHSTYLYLYIGTIFIQIEAGLMHGVNAWVQINTGVQHSEGNKHLCMHNVEKACVNTWSIIIKQTHTTHSCMSVCTSMCVHVRMCVT